MGFCHATSLKRQRGSAIVFAMGISLLVVALSVALLLWLTLDIRRVQQLQDASQRFAALEYIEAMAAEKIHALPEDWSSPWPLSVGEYTGEAKLEDLTGRLNINAVFLTEKKDTDFFSPRAVITRFLTKQSIENPKLILETIEDRGHILLGVRMVPNLTSVKDYFYGGKSDSHQININTTTPEVLGALLDVSPGIATAILAKRPYESMEAVQEMLLLHELKYDPPSLIEEWLSVEGRYYVLEIALKQKRDIRIYSVFYKDQDKVTLKWRSWGTLP